MKNNWQNVGNTVFSIITLLELSVAMETRILNLSESKPNAAFFPNPMMLQIKFDHKWPTGCRDIHCLKVWTDGRTHRRTHGRRLDSHPISLPYESSPQVSYKCDKAKKKTCVSANPTDPIFLCRPCNFAIKNKIKRFSCLPTLSLFHKLKKYCPS